MIASKRESVCTSRTPQSASSLAAFDDRRGLTSDVGLPIVDPWVGMQVKEAASSAALESASIDQVAPPAGSRWRFDQDVTDVFENMLSRSIPEYDTMRSLVFELGATLVQPGTAIVDIGCSKGDALEPFVRRFGAANRYVGAELSEAMLDAARSRFATQIAQGAVDIRNLDLRTEYPQEMASLTLAVLTVQFIPIEYRQKLMQRIAAHTLPGGGLVFVRR